MVSEISFTIVRRGVLTQGLKATIYLFATRIVSGMQGIASKRE
jgi:hypothetical protein